MDTSNETTEAEVVEETEDAQEEEAETEVEETEEQSEEETTTEATETKPKPKPKEKGSKEETPQAKEARLARQLEQHRKKHGLSAAERAETGDDGVRMDRVELRQEGITDKKQQDAVIDYARYKKIDVLTALATPSVKAEIKALQAKSATPAPSNRAGGGKGDDVAHWARQLTVYGKPAPTAELRKKVLEHLAKGNQ